MRRLLMMIVAAFLAIAVAEDKKDEIIPVKDSRYMKGGEKGREWKGPSNDKDPGSASLLPPRNSKIGDKQQDESDDDSQKIDD